MRIVGDRSISEIELDPVKAYHRGRVLDAMLRNALPPHPRRVFRGTHEYFNRMDDERRLMIARRLNGQGVRVTD